MAQAGYTPIQMYHSSTTGALPPTGNLLIGELGVNVTDRQIYTKDAGGNIVALGGSGAKASGSVLVNNTTINENYTIAAGTNGFSVGSITISTGYGLTVATNQKWFLV